MGSTLGSGVAAGGHVEGERPGHLPLVRSVGPQHVHEVAEEGLERVPGVPRLGRCHHLMLRREAHLRYIGVGGRPGPRRRARSLPSRSRVRLRAWYPEGPHRGGSAARRSEWTGCPSMPTTTSPASRPASDGRAPGSHRRPTTAPRGRCDVERRRRRSQRPGHERRRCRARSRASPWSTCAATSTSCRATSEHELRRGGTPPSSTAVGPVHLTASPPPGRDRSTSGQPRSSPASGASATVAGEARECSRRPRRRWPAETTVPA